MGHEFRLKRTARNWTLVLGFIAGVVGAAVSIYDMTNIQSAISDSHGVVSAGWGLWVDCIASVSSAVALVVLWRTGPVARDDSVRQPTAAPPA